MGLVDILKGFVTGILILILMAALPVYIISNSLQSTVLQQSFYEQQLQETGLYIKLQGLMIDNIVSQFPESELSKYGITKTDVKNAMSKAITVDWVKNETNKNIKQVLWYLNDQTKGVNLSISLRPKVEEGGAILISEKIGVDKDTALTLLKSTVSLDSIPDPITLESVAPGTTNALKGLKENVMMFKSFSGQLLIGIIIILVLIFLLTLSLDKFARTIGIPFIVTGIILFVASFMLPGMVKDAVKGTGMTESQNVITMTNVMDFLSPIFGSIMTQAIILIAAGVILVAFSFVYPMIVKKEKK